MNNLKRLLRVSVSLWLKNPNPGRPGAHGGKTQVLLNEQLAMNDYLGANSSELANGRFAPTNVGGYGFDFEGSSGRGDLFDPSCSSVLRPLHEKRQRTTAVQIASRIPAIFLDCASPLALFPRTAKG